MNRARGVGDGGNGFARIAARSEAHRHERRASGANLEDDSGGGASAARTLWSVRRSSSAWIRARRSLSPSRHICIRRTRKRTNPNRRKRPKIVILGSGPNRIGQGIEFDYCCCHASFALREDGFETIMVNCNPETVSTDYDTSDRLYFEPLTLEDVLAIVEREKPQGVIVQFGGQTPLNLALELKRNGVPIIGTAPESIDLAEDRRRFGRLLEELRIPQPRNGTALVPEEAARVAGEIGLPVLVRPSYVLGGRAMVIAYDVNTVQEYVAQAALMGPARPVLIDQFLEEATEVDVDALADGERRGHWRNHGAHRRSRRALRRFFVRTAARQLAAAILNTIRDYTKRLALALKVVGLMNVQYAIQRDTVYVLEVNPRASRTVPYVSKATGVPLAKVAARLMAGRKLVGHESAAGGSQRRCRNRGARFLLGEIAGVSVQQIPRRGHHPGTGNALHRRSDGHLHFVWAGVRESATRCGPEVCHESGTIFISVNDRDKRQLGQLGGELVCAGFQNRGHARNRRGAACGGSGVRRSVQGE